MQENPVFCVSKKRKSTMTITKFQPKPQKPLSVLHALRASVPRHRSKFCSNKLDSPCLNTSEQPSALQHNQKNKIKTVDS